MGLWPFLWASTQIARAVEEDTFRKICLANAVWTSLGCSCISSQVTGDFFDLATHDLELPFEIGTKHIVLKKFLPVEIPLEA